MLWVLERLRTWSDWARGNHLIDSPRHPLASLIRIAAGESPGRDLDVPYDLTPEIETTEKAIARLKQQNARYKRVIMRYWLGRVPIYEIAAEFRVSEDRAKEMLLRAQGQVGRNILMLESGVDEQYSWRRTLGD